MSDSTTPLDQPDQPLVEDRWKFMLYLGLAICSAGVVGHFLHYYPSGAMLVTVGLLVMHVRSSLIFFTEEGKEKYQYFYYIGRSLLVAGVSLVFWGISFPWIIAAAGIFFLAGMLIPAQKDGPMSGDDY